MQANRALGRDADAAWQEDTIVAERGPPVAAPHVRMTIKTLLLLLSACGPAVSNNAPAVPRNPQELISTAAENCKDDISEKAAQAAREKFPDSTTIWFSQTWASRWDYLRENRWLLFDVDHNRRMSFEEYHAWIWASFLVGATPGRCILMKKQFLDGLLNKRTDSMSGWVYPSSLRFAEASWQIFDPNGRGFLIKDDLKDADLASFSRADTFHRGYLTPEQTF